MKEIQLSAVIDAHDFATKLNHAIGFLSEDMKVRLKLRFKGRQKAHKEVGFDVINRFVAATAAYGRTDTPPKLLGDRDLNVTIIPLPKDKRPKQKAEKATPSAESLPAQRNISRPTKWNQHPTRRLSRNPLRKTLASSAPRGRQHGIHGLVKRAVGSARWR